MWHVIRCYGVVRKVLQGVSLRDRLSRKHTQSTLPGLWPGSRLTPDNVYPVNDQNMFTIID